MSGSSLERDGVLVHRCLRRAVEANGGAPATVDDVLRVLREVVGRDVVLRPLRVELLLEALALDPRSPVRSAAGLGDREPGYLA